MTNNPEYLSCHRNIIRPPDMGAVMCYALDAISWEQVCQITGCNNNITLPRGKTSATVQTIIIANAGLSRMPNLIYNMRCGRCEVAAVPVYMCSSAVAVNPSHATGALVDETACHFYGLRNISAPFERTTCIKALHKSVQTPDAIIFCESVEHAPIMKLVAAFDWIRDSWGCSSLSQTGSRTTRSKRRRAATITCTTSTNEMYNCLASRARKTVTRRGSHSVLQF